MIGENMLQPGLRAVRSGEHLSDIAQHVPAKLVTAIARRLAHAQQPGAFKILDGFLGNAALILATLRALLEDRHQRAGARHQLLRRRMPSERHDV